ncbi:MAG: iron transporter FeoA [Desulfobulbaceae bacterium S3730MH12]|nr:MAG: iron transporter FeoA [Desulfobulbaceae bacterium S5133MH15]OEU55137.1 MAG: iron transporter FeoA [Desulfobulbaceae bacterium S3730MH12]OEU78955.1 MAG: iron transporter FeoA [Desulfobulbaceae bacterium C00003063]
MQTVVLRNMKKNQSGIIKAVSVGGVLGRRLREMGLTPGTEISVCGRAPLKDPVAIRVLNSILTLRNNEAEHIHVLINNNQ